MTERNYFKEKLYHHSMPVSEGMWNAIEAQLPPEGKQKRFPVFWMTLFGTALLGGALMIGVFSRNADTTSPPSPPAQEDVMASSLSQEGLHDQAGTDDASQHMTIPHENEAHTTSRSTISSTSLQTASETSTADMPHVIGDAEMASKITLQNTNSTQQKNNSNTILISYDGELTINESDMIDLQEEDMIIFEDQELSEDSYTIPYRNTSLTEALPPADFQTSASSSLLLMPGIAPDPNCYKFGDIGAHWAMSVDMMVGPGYSFKSYEGNGGETSDYISARKATESYQYAWSTGARINMHHRNGLTARLGLNYTQAGDIFDYTDSLATQSTTRIDSFFAADGTFLYTEVTQVLIDGTLVKKIHNTYRYLDIPLLVGYEMRIGRNLVMLNAGPVFNLTHTYEGQILDSMLHPRSITPGEPGAIDIYKTNLGMSLYLSAGILFPLSDRFSALIEPSYIHRFKPVTLNSYALKENRNHLNLNLGVRYHIN